MTIREKYLRIPPEKWKRYQTKERTTGWKPPWFKMWSAILDDHVIRSMEPEARWVYVGILCLANECNNRVDSRAETLAFRLTTPVGLVRIAVRTLIANGLIEPCPARSVDKVSKTLQNDCRSEVHPKIEDRREKREKPDVVQLDPSYEQHLAVDNSDPEGVS